MTFEKSTAGGFTLIEIMIVVALVGLLATVATPTWIRARTTSQTNSCINNLRQIEGATQSWAVENNRAANSIPDFTDIRPYLKSTVICPAGGNSFADSYELHTVNLRPTCRRSANHVLPDVSN